MSFNKEEQGMSLADYKDKLSDGSKTLRIGKEVPEGAVNLAYIHTPRIQVDENVALVDTSASADNVIPQDQLESMAVANDQGILEYVDLIGNDQVVTRPPADIFPSNKVSITRQFKKGEARTENALYYKFEIDYHYDSKVALPDKDGNFAVERYTGQQIELTDENGNVLDNSYKHEIYVQAQKENPRIYSVRIYLDKNTDSNETIKVRYNHIDRVVKDETIESVDRSIELYSNKTNSIVVNELNKQMLEGGKLRIVNGYGSFKEVTVAEVQAAMSSTSEEEIFAVMPKEDGSGYQLKVTQKSEVDPRVVQAFSYRLVATYPDANGNEVKVSVGHVSDWVIDPKALLRNEMDEYTREWKSLGIPVMGIKTNAKEMIELSLPFGTPSIPSSARYTIEDGSGSVLYSVKQLASNASVDTRLVGTTQPTMEVKSNLEASKLWDTAMKGNTVVKNAPIAHRVSVIPERQKTRMDFGFKVDGQGYTERSHTYKNLWSISATAAFYKNQEPQLLDVLTSTKWDVIGLNPTGDDLNRVVKTDWLYSYVPSMGKTVLSFQKNPMDLVGFYQKEEKIDGQTVNLMTKSDYEFSTRVKMEDPVDDDMIGIMFRVKDSKNFYGFYWEAEDMKKKGETYTSNMGDGSLAGITNGVGRVHLDANGLTTLHFDPAGKATENWKWTNNITKYLNSGFGYFHKRIFKATPSTKPKSSETNPTSQVWTSATQYPSDRTGCKFEDITTKDALYMTAAGKRGWEYGKEYKITVSVTGNEFRVYINEDPNSNSRGVLVCKGIDSEHKQGSYGIFTISQRWTYWYDMKMTEISVDKVTTEPKEITLTDNSRKKLSNYMAKDILKPLLDARSQELYKNSGYEVIGYSGEPSGDLIVTVDPNDGFIYGQTNSPMAGGTTRTPWKTQENEMTVNGVGYIEYHSDGHMTVHMEPEVLPTERIPSGVDDFIWSQPVLQSGEGVTVQLNGASGLKATASVPPITMIGKPFTLPEGIISKEDSMKSLTKLFGQGGIYDKLEIPDTIPLHEILLRLERGEVTGVSPTGAATVTNPEYRVNYRFRAQKNGFMRLPVDQFKDHTGVNRIRLKDFIDDTGKIDATIETDIIGWTTYQELESVPLFAVKIEEEKKVEIAKPAVELKSMETDNWYLRVKNGRFLKRVELPYHEIGSIEKVPEVYVAYPELLGMVKNPGDVVEVDLEYGLPSYVDQEFHNRPVVFIDKEAPVILSEYAIQTRFAPLVLRSEAGKSYITVYSERGELRRDLRVSDIDSTKGIIYLHDRIREQDNVYVNYAYKEEWFTYRGFYKEVIEYDEAGSLSLEKNEMPQAKNVRVLNGKSVLFITYLIHDIQTEFPEIYNDLTERGWTVSTKRHGEIYSLSDLNSYDMIYLIEQCTFSPQTAQAIKEYLRTGRRAILTMDPGSTYDALERYKWIIDEYPIRLGGDISISGPTTWWNDQSPISTPGVSLKYYKYITYLVDNFEAMQWVAKVTTWSGSTEGIVFTHVMTSDGQVLFHGADDARNISTVKTNYTTDQNREYLLKFFDLEYDYASYESVNPCAPEYTLSTTKITNDPSSYASIFMSSKTNTSGVKAQRYWSEQTFFKYRDLSHEGNGEAQIYSTIHSAVPMKIYGEVEYNDGQVCLINPFEIKVDPIPCNYSLDPYSSTMVTGETVRLQSQYVYNTSGIKSYEIQCDESALQVTVVDATERLVVDVKALRQGRFFIKTVIIYNNDQVCTSNNAAVINIVDPVCDVTLSEDVIEIFTGETTQEVFGSFQNNKSGVSTFEWLKGSQDVEVIDSKINTDGTISAKFKGVRYGDFKVRLSVTYNDGQVCVSPTFSLSVRLRPCELTIDAPIDTVVQEKSVSVFATHANTSGIVSFGWTATGGVKKGAMQDENSVSVIGTYVGTGIVYLNVTYADGQQCTASVAITVTPKPRIRKEFFHLDLNPTHGHRYTVAHNGFHKWIPVDVDQEKFTIPEMDNESKELLVKQLHIYMRPVAIRYVSPDNPSSHGTIIPGTLKEEVLCHTDEEWWFNPKDYRHDITLLRLGKVNVQANSTMEENMTILDTRTRGGGLDESLSREIIGQVNRESLYHWDIGYFDGEAYQENGVMVVKLPASILRSEENPNGFHETEVQAAVAKHKAFGALPIIEYYEDRSNDDILNIVPNSTFKDGKSIGYFDPLRSNGEYEYIPSPTSGAGNHVLMITRDGEYAMTMPGHLFQENRYRIEVRGIKEYTAGPRSLGTIEVFYMNGTTKKIQMQALTEGVWKNYSEWFKVTGQVHHVTIKMNEAPEERFGRILYDFIKIKPDPEHLAESVEVHEI